MRKLVQKGCVRNESCRQGPSVVFVFCYPSSYRTELYSRSSFERSLYFAIDRRARWRQLCLGGKSSRAPQPLGRNTQWRREELRLAAINKIFRGRWNRARSHSL